MLLSKLDAKKVTRYLIQGYNLILLCASAIGIYLSDCNALVIITNETGSSGSSQGGKWTLGSQKLHPKTNTMG